MEEQFWQSRWAAGKIAFHENEPNRFLQDHLTRLRLPTGAHIFVPLCGKSNDLDWLLDQGHRVSGIEFSRDAVDAVFARHGLDPVVTEVSGLQRLSRGRLTLWQGDFFSLQKAELGAVDAVYDRAALVALPDQMRRDYATALPRLTTPAPQLLVSFSYDQSQTDGPPFSVPEQTIHKLYGDAYDIELLASERISGPFADRCNGQEQAWVLTAK